MVKEHTCTSCCPIPNASFSVQKLLLLQHSIPKGKKHADTFV